MLNLSHVCPYCGGNGTVASVARHVLAMPAGVASGMAFEWASMGHTLPGSDAALAPGQRPQGVVRLPSEGSLVLTVHVDEDATCERDGDDLLTDVNISLVEALTGFARDWPHPDGTNVSIVRRGVTMPAEVLVVPGRGLPALPSAPVGAPAGSVPGVGDLRVRVNVIFPATLREYQRAVLQTMRPGFADDSPGWDDAPL